MFYPQPCEEEGGQRKTKREMFDRENTMTELKRTPSFACIITVTTVISYSGIEATLVIKILGCG